jgi:hypothetical protein
MFALRFIEDTTEPPERGVLIGLHPDETSAHLAWVFVTGNGMSGAYVLGPDGMMLHADKWAKRIFGADVTVLRGGKP